MVRTLSALTIAASLCAAAGSTASAGTVSFTSPVLNPFGDCTPVCTPQYQQVYAASSFSGPITITGLQFEYNFGDFASTYVLSLSTSQNTVGNLSANFSANLGADNQLFYSGAWITPDLSFQGLFVGAPFYYDPTAGDLLLNITHNSAFTPGVTSTVIGSYNEDPVPVGPVSRNYAFDSTSSSGFTNDAGLKTIIHFESTVPEPATWGLIIGGFGLTGAVLRRRRALDAA